MVTDQTPTTQAAAHADILATKAAVLARAVPVSGDSSEAKSEPKWAEPMIGRPTLRQ